MTYDAFLTRVIDDGIAAATEDYKDSPYRREGAVAGFNACRGKDTNDLWYLLRRARRVRNLAYGSDIARVRRILCFAAEVEWVCNVVSAMLTCDTGTGIIRAPIITPTARGVIKAAEILGVRSEPPRASDGDWE